jgi:dethiobiotin synthetase
VSRPGHLVVVSGTGTDVGKTWVAARLACALGERGIAVAARKPAQSYAPGDETDADVLARATGDDPRRVCPAHRWYEVPMAPPMAAEILGRPAFTIAALVAELEWPAVDVGLVESAGGPRSPLASDGDTVDLARALAPDLVVLVADAGLGTINAVRLSVSVLAPVAPVCTILNHYDDADDLHRRNRDWLATHATQTVVVATIDDLTACVTGPREQQG